MVYVPKYKCFRVLGTIIIGQDRKRRRTKSQVEPWAEYFVSHAKKFGFYFTEGGQD